jgi:hypothetical protein
MEDFDGARALQKQAPDVVKQFVKDSPWFAADQKSRVEARDTAEVVARTTGDKVAPLGDQVEVKVVRRVSPTEATTKLLFRLSEGEAVVEIKAAYQDGAWTTTGFTPSYEPGVKTKDKFEFQIRKLMLAIDGAGQK